MQQHYYMPLYFARNRKSRNKQTKTKIITQQERATQYQQRHTLTCGNDLDTYRTVPVA